MKKRTLNVHISESEHAWLTSFARFENISMTQIIRDQIRDSMRRELALAGIEAGLRCSWAFCFVRPVGAGNERPDLCGGHSAMVARQKCQEAANAAELDGKGWGR